MWDVSMYAFVRVSIQLVFTAFTESGVFLCGVFVPVAPYLNHYLCCGKMFNQPFNMLLLFIVIEVMGSIGTNQRQKALSGLNINLLFIWCIRLQIFVYEIFNQQGKMNKNVRGNREPNSRLQIIIFFIEFFVTQFTRLSDSNFLRC